MLNDVSSYEPIWIVLSVLMVIILVMLHSTSKRGKILARNTERMENALKEKTVEEIVHEQQLLVQNVTQKLSDGSLIFSRLQDELSQNDEQLKYIEVGLLPPTFKFDDSQALKNKINSCLEDQFRVIQSGGATRAYSDWDWFGSKKDGARMVGAYQSLLLKAFNAEFDMIRKQMCHSTDETAKKKLIRLEEQLGKLGETANVTISSSYFNLKHHELMVWYGMVS